MSNKSKDRDQTKCGPLVWSSRLGAGLRAEG